MVCLHYCYLLSALSWCVLSSASTTAHCLVNYLSLRIYCVALRFLGFSKSGYYECNACRCQSGDAGKGECGEDQLGREIRSSSVPGRPIPERECQLLCFNLSACYLFASCLLPGWKASFLYLASGMLWLLRLKSVTILKHKSSDQNCVCPREKQFCENFHIDAKPVKHASLMFCLVICRLLLTP